MIFVTSAFVSRGSFVCFFKIWLPMNCLRERNGANADLRQLPPKSFEQREQLSCWPLTAIGTEPAGGQRSQQAPRTGRPFRFTQPRGVEPPRMGVVTAPGKGETEGQHGTSGKRQNEWIPIGRQLCTGNKTVFFCKRFSCYRGIRKVTACGRCSTLRLVLRLRFIFQPQLAFRPQAQFDPQEIEERGHLPQCNGQQELEPRTLALAWISILWSIKTQRGK